ncbi:MAG: arabinan endo-1,5-alpha-L-arabinosidase [Verrucomicrobiia bacterium]
METLSCYDLNMLFHLRRHSLALVLSLALLPEVFAAPSMGFEPLVPEGDTFVHDPSTIQTENGRYFLFSTGRGISTKSASSLLRWSDGPSVFPTPPAWATNLVRGYRGHTWAPDVIRISDRYLLYYSVSTFGKQFSAIGLATNQTLDPLSPQWQWTDHGPVIQSVEGSPFNAIDPAVFLDAEERFWMVFGSFWKGIYLCQLDPETGLRLDPDAPPRRVAWNESIEAPCITRHGGFYYLFVNWGRCCRGIQSTYEIRVGRSKDVTGPYLDGAGVDLVDGGGTLFLATSGRFIGPGHMGVFTESGNAWFSFHYYDRDSNGRSRLALGRLEWTEDGWPAARSPVGPWKPVLPTQARDFPMNAMRRDSVSSS